MKTPTGFEEFRNSLQLETLQEMADNFFSARRIIEEEVEMVYAHLQDLRAQEERALDRLALLHALLPDQEHVRQLYDLLLLPTETADFMAHMLQGRTPRLPFPLPGGLRWSARFSRLFELAYTFAFDACDTYMHGRYKHNPRTGSRSLTLHYRGFHTWCNAMNRRITQINTSQEPSQVLLYARSLQENDNAQNASGAPLNNFSANIDNSLKIPLLECDGLGLVPMPELPSPVRAGRIIRDFAKMLVSKDKHNGNRLRETIARLNAARDTSISRLEDR